jgi:hypothetical protein
MIALELVDQQRSGYATVLETLTFGETPQGVRVAVTTAGSGVTTEHAARITRLSVRP